MKRGEIRWYKIQNPDKKRPVLILTRDTMIEYLNEVTIAPITRTIRSIPTEVVLTKSEGVPTACAVNCDHLQTVAKGKIGASSPPCQPKRWVKWVQPFDLLSISASHNTFLANNPLTPPLPKYLIWTLTYCQAQTRCSPVVRLVKIECDSGPSGSNPTGKHDASDAIFGICKHWFDKRLRHDFDIRAGGPCLCGHRPDRG